MPGKKDLSLYWKCQLTGWSLASLYWAFIGITGGGFNPWLGLLQFITDLLGYVWLTHMYRNMVVKLHWPGLPLNQLIRRIIPAIVVMGCAYTLFTLCKVYLFRTYFVSGFSESFFVFAKSSVVLIFVAGIRLMSIWLLAYHLYHYAQREIRIAKENAKLAIESRDAQLNNLSSQLNPHFLFNSLNTIKSLISKDPVHARRGIDLLSDVLRSSLYKGESLHISIAEELDVVRDYLSLEKMRMDERLDFEIKVDEQVTNRPIPRLSIQTLVENAVKHGISQSVSGGIVRVEVSGNENFSKILVSNTGSLIRISPAKGIGLQNLRTRLGIMHDNKAVFEISSSGNMVHASIIIPAQ